MSWSCGEENMVFFWLQRAAWGSLTKQVFAEEPQTGAAGRICHTKQIKARSKPGLPRFCFSHKMHCPPLQDLSAEVQMPSGCSYLTVCIQSKADSQHQGTFAHWAPSLRASAFPALPAAIEPLGGLKPRPSEASWALPLARPPVHSVFFQYFNA